MALPEPIAIELPSGRVARIKGYVHTGASRELFRNEDESPREQFMRMIAALREDGEQLDKEDLVDMSDDELRAIGEKLIEGDELEDKMAQDEESDFFKRFLKVQKGQWQELYDKETAISHKLFGPSLRQANQLSNLVKQMQSTVSFVPPSPNTRLDLSGLRRPEPELLSKLLTAERENATRNLELQRQISDTLTKLVVDSDRSARQARNQNWMILGATLAGLVVAIITLIITS